MDNIKERVKIYCKAKKLSVSKFETIINAAQGYVNKIGDKIGDRRIKDIAENFPDLNLDWLVYGTGDMLNTPYLTTTGNYNNISVQTGGNKDSFNNSSIDNKKFDELIAIIKSQQETIQELVKKLK